MKSFAVLLSVVFPALALAAQSYPLFEGAPAKKLFDSLEGPSVVNVGSTKVVTLNRQEGALLICSDSDCSIANTSFQAIRNSDNDTLFQVSGEDAHLVTSAIRNFPSRGNLDLGYVGQYGSAYLYCTSENQKKICTFGISYCYQPGC